MLLLQVNKQGGGACDVMVYLHGLIKTLIIKDPVIIKLLDLRMSEHCISGVILQIFTTFGRAVSKL